MRKSKKPTNSAVKARKSTPKTAHAGAMKARNIAKTSGSVATNSLVREDSKLAIVVGMLRAPDGATIESLTRATGWQTHSVRGAISGAIKKKLKLTVLSEKIDGIRTYRISA